MHPKTLFINRHSELRAGWRLVLFVIVGVLAGYLFSLPIQLFGLSGPFVGSLVVLIAAGIASYVMTRFINQKPFTAIGLSIHPSMPRDLAIGALLGLLMMSGIFMILLLCGWLQIGPRDLAVGDALWIVASSLVFFLVGAVAEEMLFRGYPFQTLVQGITLLPALLLMAFLFAFAHMGNPNATTFGIINVGLAAITLSIAYLKTRSLWLPFGLHFSWNFSQTTIYGFPTSGLDFNERTLFHVTQGGPEWLTGGAFGPEGGALATAALVGGTWYILKSKHLNIPEGIITLDSVEDLLEVAAQQVEATR
jgi:hypothetical protein